MSAENHIGDGNINAKREKEAEKFKVIPDSDGNGYQISGTQEDLLELGQRLYNDLGGEYFDEGQLKAGRALRPQGYFWVRLNPNSNRLEVSNQNRKGDKETNEILRSRVEDATK